MKYRIITISRQFGSGGRTIGKEVAERLNIPCYDRELVEFLAEESGFSQKTISELDEHAVRKKLFSNSGERARQNSYLQSSLWNVQEKVIRELAQKGPCVIVGRCAGHILEDTADCLRVYIHADAEKRAERIVNVYGETEEAPLKRIRDQDKRREEYYRRYTGKKWGDAENFHITLDSGELGIETCIEILTKLY